MYKMYVPFCFDPGIMLKRYLLLLACLFVAAVGFCQAPDGFALLRQVHKKFRNGPCKSYTFSQRNTHYRNDSVVRHSEWQEAIELPDKFRIDFGNKADSNYVVFRNDSVFNYRKGKFIKSRADSNTL